MRRAGNAGVRCSQDRVDACNAGVHPGVDVAILWCAHFLVLEMEMIGKECGYVLYSSIAAFGGCHRRVNSYQQERLVGQNSKKKRKKT